MEGCEGNFGLHSKDRQGQDSQDGRGVSHCGGLAALNPLCIVCRTEKRDTRREVKALKAAKVENAIEQELLNRLKQGTYGDIYNFDQKVYERVLEAAEVPAVMPPPLMRTCHTSAVQY